MIGLFCFALAVLASPFKSKLRLEAENAVLRHQLIVLSRRRRGRVRLTNLDRWFFIQLYRWFPAILRVLALAQNRISLRLRLMCTLELAPTGGDRGSRRSCAY
jgi:hypothetical protein